MIPLGSTLKVGGAGSALKSAGSGPSLLLPSYLATNIKQEGDLTRASDAIANLRGTVVN
jgi:hypothetical protein